MPLFVFLFCFVPWHSAARILLLGGLRTGPEGRAAQQPHAATTQAGGPGGRKLVKPTHRSKGPPLLARRGRRPT